jgi:hypothetical protein
MLAVIFGAGASYDGFPTFPLDGRTMGHARMPLANDLFDNRPLFEAMRERFRACLPLIPYLQNRPGGRSVEQVLEQFELEASKNGDSGDRIRQQLTAVKFYLQSIVFECEQASTRLAQGVTNHLTLIDLIEKSRPKGEAVCLITFNYDCLIERALADGVNFSIASPLEYICKPRYKLFKLHGSVNWGHIIMLMPSRQFRGRNDHEMNEMIRDADKIERSSDFEIVNEIPAFNIGAQFVFPAITIPAEQKTKFSCPPSHIDMLKSLLPNVTKLLVIGWRGAENHFLQMAGPILGTTNTTALEIGIVSASRDSCSETEVAIAGAITGPRDWSYFPNGFTNFIVSRAAESFIEN